MEQLTFIDILREKQPTDGHKQKTWHYLPVAGTRHVFIPVQMLLSLPEMVYPGSQVQWVVPCVMVQRDGRTFGLLVAAGRTEAAAVAEDVAADVFVMVTKTEGGGQGERQTNKSCGRYLVLSYSTSLSFQQYTLIVVGGIFGSFLRKNQKARPESRFFLRHLISDVGFKYCDNCERVEYNTYMLAGGSDRCFQTSLWHRHRRTGSLHPHMFHHSGMEWMHTRWCLSKKHIEKSWKDNLHHAKLYLSII